jgi:hypothetical protein
VVWVREVSVDAPSPCLKALVRELMQDEMSARDPSLLSPRDHRRERRDWPRA